MSQHPNARLTPWGRQRLVERIEAGEAVGEAARQMGVSRQTASKWVARARRGEPLSDRPSRPVLMFTKKWSEWSPLFEHRGH